MAAKKRFVVKSHVMEFNLEALNELYVYKDVDLSNCITLAIPLNEFLPKISSLTFNSTFFCAILIKICLLNVFGKLSIITGNRFFLFIKNVE